MSDSDEVSIVEYYAENEGYKCGYCKSPNTNYSHGMWAHGLTVGDYQSLIDRGWRRSGYYCYKPTMNMTCCPMYTIKCSALDFKLSKSQKKKLKRVHGFLAFGKNKSTVGLTDVGSNESTSDVESADDMPTDLSINDLPGLKDKAERALLNIGNAIVNSVEASIKDRLKSEVGERSKYRESSAPSTSGTADVCMIQGKIEESPKPSVKKSSRPGDGMDPNRPQCKKAKLLRQERKEKKLAQLSPLSAGFQKTKTPSAAKSLEDFINEPLPDSPAHRLEIRLVRSNPASKEFKSTFKAALEVYQRYQITIHNDPVEKVTEKQFTRFLVNSPLKIKLVNVASSEMSQTLDTSWALYAKYQMFIHKEDTDECDLSTYTRFLVNSPLKPWKPSDGPPQGYGSFHQQYWLDGRLIAVGVIDILPRCVSSVYFFYDPEFHFLVLGIYGSLREIAFCRSLHHLVPSLQYYYMGFYIHTCPKMRYKGSFSPSLLLCPEVYSWHKLEYCIPLLERNKYCRFNEDPNAKDPDQVVSVYSVKVIFQNEVMHYKTYLLLKPTVSHLQEVTQYADLVGNKLSTCMLLILM